MRTITLSEARAMASDPAYIAAEDVGRMAILSDDGDGSGATLVDLAGVGETENDAIAAYLRRVCEDDAEGMSCAMIVADETETRRPTDSYGMTAEQSAANVARIEAGTDARRKLAECVCPKHCAAWDRGCSPTVGADDRLTCPQADVPRHERK